MCFSFLQVLPALRYIRAIGAEDSASPRKFLEAASNPEDSMLFYTGMPRDYNLIHFKFFFLHFHLQPKVWDEYLCALFVGWSIRQSVRPSVCVCSPVSQYHLFSQSACLSAHPSVSVSQSVIDYTSHMWFLFPLYVHIRLSFANKHIYIDVFFFFAVYKFFEQRNVRLRGNPDFAPGAKFVFIFIKSIFCLLLVVLLMLVLHEYIKRIT